MSIPLNIEKPTWDYDSVAAIYLQPFNDLLFQAHSCHRQHHNPNALHIAKLLSIKTGACPEDCGYCSQSGRYKTHVEKEKLMAIDEVLAQAKIAKAQGAKRFCMGAAWRSPPDKAFEHLTAMVAGVKAIGLETCMTLGMLSAPQAQLLKTAGLDYYNHNIDTSENYYDKVVTTRKFSDRITTINHVRNAGINVCCGGILGIGETYQDRIEFLIALANMPTPPESVPINRLIAVAGTPLANALPIDGIELVRTIATARILMPKSMVRLSAGRAQMSEELQALCFYAGANSAWIGDKLLTEANACDADDAKLYTKLGLETIAQ